MASRLGFSSVADFERWEDEIVIDHFANFICDYLAPGYTIVPEKKGFVEFVDLEKAVEERIEMLEERRFEMVLDPDKGDCKFFFLLPSFIPPFCNRFFFYSSFPFFFFYTFFFPFPSFFSLCFFFLPFLLFFPFPSVSLSLPPPFLTFLIFFL